MTNEDQLKTSLGAWVEIFRNTRQGQEGNKPFRKTKKSSHKKYTKYSPFTSLQIASKMYFLGFKIDQNVKLHSFSLQYQPSWRQPWKNFHYQ